MLLQFLQFLFQGFQLFKQVFIVLGDLGYCFVAEQKV